MKSVHLVILAVVATAVFALGIKLALAEDRPMRADVWSLKLGTPASMLPHDAL